MVKMFAKNFTLLFFESTNKTNNGFLHIAHRGLFYGVYNAKNNYVFKKKLTKLMLTYRFHRNVYQCT